MAMPDFDAGLGTPERYVRIPLREEGDTTGESERQGDIFAIVLPPTKRLRFHSRWRIGKGGQDLPPLLHPGTLGFQRKVKLTGKGRFRKSLGENQFAVQGSRVSRRWCNS